MRPRVLIASTHPVTGMALSSIMKVPCRRKGLKLVLPEAGCFNSADELFEFLSRQHPAELADWLVLIDLGETSLDEAFAPSAGSRDTGWQAGQHRSGIGVELLLRFPQIYPMFMSISVPTAEDPAGQSADGSSEKKQDSLEVAVGGVSGSRNEDDHAGVGNGKSDWPGFESFKKQLTIANRLLRKETKKENYGQSQATDEVSESSPGQIAENTKKEEKKSKDDALLVEESEPYDSYVFAFKPTVHFVSPLDVGKDQCTILNRFANGLRCWFDPTGLRTLVKNCFLGTLFGSSDDWSNTWVNNGGEKKFKDSVLRKRLLARLDKVAVAIDEEREFAMLNAYAAWKYGRRGWVITTYAEFGSDGLWRKEEAEDMVILRDIDLRFPDMSSDNRAVNRSDLMNIYSDEWKKLMPKSAKILVRAISGEKAVHREKSGKRRTWEAEEIRLGQKVIEQGKEPEYLGYPKPLSSLYELRSCLGVEGKEQASSVLGKLGVAGDLAKYDGLSSGHGAPYRNHSIAKFLLVQARRCGRGTEENLIAALLASEAYEILIGMSKETGLSALEAMQRAEVRAEVAFSGITETASIDERKADLQETLKGLFQSVNKPFQRRRLFVAQMWEDLRSIYKNAERFQAAEQANIESLVHSEWGRRFKIRFESEFFGERIICLKRCLVYPASSLIGWVLYVLFASVIFTAAYWFHDIRAGSPPSSWGDVVYYWSEVMRAAMSIDLMGRVKDQFEGPGPVGWIHMISLLHLAVSYLFFGLLISMLYRKVTRG